MPEFLSEKLTDTMPLDPVREIAIDTVLESIKDKRPGNVEENRIGPLRDLRRLRQLVQESQTALTGENLSVVSQAAALLAPALAQWAIAGPLVDAHDSQMLQLTQETQRAMAECEQAMRLVMNNIETKRNHLRQHQRHLQRLRALRPAPHSGRSLDARQ